MGDLYWKHLLKKNVNEIPEIEVFLGRNLNFKIKIFTWGLVNDDNICKKTILFNAISNLRGLSNEKVLQLTKQHVAPEF